MSPLNNPFSPGAGSPPPELVGRENVLQHCEILLARTLKGRPEKSILLTGLRGVGKTVLLNVMGGISEDNGFLTIQIEAHEGKKLGPLLTNAVRSLLLKLDRMEGAKDKLRRSFAVLKSFIGSVKVNYEDLSFGLDIDPERGTATVATSKSIFPRSSSPWPRWPGKREPPSPSSSTSCNISTKGIERPDHVDCTRCSKSSFPSS